MLSLLRPALVMFGALTILTGLAYPLAVSGAAQLLFPEQANGSLLVHQGKTVGSRLIGQSFSAPGYFWGRPSATGPMPNNGAGSGGANLGPSNAALLEAYKGRIDALRSADPGNPAPIPVDLVSASASGLDPEISMAAAVWQERRVAAARKMTVDRVHGLVQANSAPQYFGFFGEARVNVLALNLALDAQTGHTP